MDLDEFSRIAGEVLDNVPDEFLQGLNGGVIVEERAKHLEDGPPGSYALGEYRHQEPGLGRFIVLYYGSFKRVFPRAGRNALRREIEKTVLHEVQHHVESLAGVRYLEREDLVRLQEMIRRAERRTRGGVD